MAHKAMSELYYVMAMGLCARRLRELPVAAREAGVRQHRASASAEGNDPERAACAAGLAM